MTAPTDSRNDQHQHPYPAPAPWWLRLSGFLLLFLLPLGWWVYQYPPQTPKPVDSYYSDSSVGLLQKGQLLDRVIKRGYLRVAIRISPTIYIPDPRNPQGIEYDLVKRFAKQLGVGVQFIVVNSLNEAYDRVYRGEADLAAAGLVVSHSREQRFRYGPSYLTVRRQLIYRRGVQKPDSIRDIGNNYVSIARGSSTADWLHNQNPTDPADPNFPSYVIQTRPLGDGMDVIDALDKGEIDYAVVFSHEALLGQQISNNIRVATDLGPPVSFAWAFSRRSDGSLYRAAVRFFAQMRASHVLKTLIDRYYAQFEQMNHALAQRFLDAVQDRIQPYLAAFKAAGKRYDIDWRLLAAMGYQESKWHSHAVSHQGAYGLMQITRKTAKDLGLRNLRDPVKNIMSAAKYINLLRKLVPDQAKEPDLTYFALAAYNIGIGHLSDAIELTRQQGGNPNLWRDVRNRILELSNPKYYRHLRFGYARGSETVQYVENIRAFHDLMIWIEERNRRLMAKDKDEPRTSTTVLR